MLAVIGAKSIDELFREIPKDLRVAPGSLNLPSTLDEGRLMDHLVDLSRRNVDLTQLTSYLGAGIYDRFIPATVGAVISRGEFSNPLCTPTSPN